MNGGMLELVDSIIMLLNKGMSNRRLYFSDHPRVENFAREVAAKVNELLNEKGEDELYLGIVSGHFVFDGKRIFGPSITGKQLMDFARRLHCGGFGLQRGVSSSDLKKFFDVSALRTIPVKRAVEAQKLFSRYGIEKIRVGEQFNDTSRTGGNGDRTQIWEGQAAAAMIESPTLLYQELFDVVSTAHGNAAFDRAFDVDNARSVSEFMLHYIKQNFADVMQFVYYPDFDSYTVGHSVRVASLAVYFGTKMGWSEKDLLAIGTAGLLHDIGKSKIPDQILLKKGPLDADELAVIRHHPRTGAEILLELENISTIDLAACWGHHLRYDGGGYPERPRWAVHNPLTALLHICDVFEALTAIRPYKEVMVPQSAFSIMLGDKGGFHPGLLASFITIIGLYPPGTYVRLSDHRVGMVSSAGSMIDRPELIITKSTEGEFLGVEEQYPLLLSNREHHNLQIVDLMLEYAD